MEKKNVLKEIEKKIINNEDILFSSYNEETGVAYQIINGDVSNIAMSIYGTIMESRKNGSETGVHLLQIVKDIVYNLMSNDEQLHKEFTDIMHNAGTDETVTYIDDYELIN